MSSLFFSIGHGNSIATNKVVSVVSSESAPAKRLVEQANKDGLLVDATSGKKRKSLIITESHYIFISSMSPETIVGRMEKTQEGNVLKPERVQEPAQSRQHDNSNRRSGNEQNQNRNENQNKNNQNKNFNPNQKQRQNSNQNQNQNQNQNKQ